MNDIRHLIEQLRTRNDVYIFDQSQSWLAIITKGRDSICEVTIPHDVLEWFADVKRPSEQKTVWSDWMDYCGYDDRPKEQLEAEMARDILAFINRATAAEQLLPIEIYEACTQPNAANHGSCSGRLLSASPALQLEPIDRPFRFTWDFCVVWAALAVAIFFAAHRLDLGPWYSQVAFFIVAPFIATFFTYGQVLFIRQILQSGSRGRFVARVFTTMVLAIALFVSVLSYFTHEKNISVFCIFVVAGIATAYLHWRIER